MAITYDVVNNIITDNNVNIEATADDCADLYNADKAGTLSIHARTGIIGVDGAPVAVDRALRPADYRELGGACNDLYIIVSNWTVGMVNATIQVVGTDRCGNAVVENVAVNGNGNFFLTNKFATVTSTQVTVWNGGVGDSFDYDLTQGQWGVVWFIGRNTYVFNCRIIISDGVTTTWFVDTNVHIEFLPTAFSAALQSAFWVNANGHLRFGILTDTAEKVAEQGVCVKTQWSIVPVNGPIIIINSQVGSEVFLYASHFYSDQIDSLRGGRLCLRDTTNIYQCVFDQTAIFLMGGTIDIFDVTILHGSPWEGGIGVYGAGTYTLNRINLYDSPYAIYFNAAFAGDLTNLYTRINNPLVYCFAITVDHYLINVDADAWIFLWAGVCTAEIYRQYEIDLTIRDRVTGALLNGTATLRNNTGAIVFAVPIVAGVIATQTVSHGYFDQANGSIEQLYGPFRLTIESPGYQTYDDYNLPLDEKTELHIGMNRIVDLIFVDDKVALNLDEDNPESEMYTQT